MCQLVKVEVVKAQAWHIKRIAKHMRRDDVNEILYSHQSTPEAALKAGFFANGVCWTALIDGKPAIMFGVTDRSLLTGTGTPWLLSTDEIKHIKKAFILESKKYIIEAMKGRTALVNYVHAGNAQSIKWLKWVGFDLEDKTPMGPAGEDFHRFSMRAK